MDDGAGVFGEKDGELASGVEDEDGEVLTVGEAWLLGEARGDGEDGVSAVECAMSGGERSLRESDGEELGGQIDVEGGW